MFIAKFTATSGAPFNADKNGAYPLIGNVMAGTAKGTIFNGTMFIREGLKVNELYLCDNFIDPEYPENIQVKVISKVNVLEFMELKPVLGEAKVVRTTVDAEAVAEQA